MQNTEFYVKYRNNQPVPVATAYGRGPAGNLPLTTVAHMVAAYKTAVTPLLDHLSVAQLTIHLPEGVDRSALEEDCFATNEENDTDTTLDPSCLLSALISLGSSSKLPLIINASQSFSQQVGQGRRIYH